MPGPETILRDLNPKQLEAVTTFGGPVLVIAGPGSGKTRALTHRVAYLMASGVPGRNILGLTFTNKAAEEMRERVHKLLNANRKSSSRETLSAIRYPLSAPFIGTFHSFAAMLLRQNAKAIGYPSHFIIFDEGDRLSLIKSVMKELNISSRLYPPGMIASIISGLKSDLVAWDEYEGRSGDEPFGRTVARIYENYQKRLMFSRSLDFDDLIFHAVRVLKGNPEILWPYQKNFQYIHVDEFQDTDSQQYELVKLLAQKHRNIFVIGDDAQSIYGFRRADYKNILNFETDWPGAKVIFLEENYRSTPEILEAANAVISNNRDQKGKTLWTKNPSGEPPLVVTHSNERSEAQFVAGEIQELRLSLNIPWQDCAVLYRTNAQSRALEEAMIEHNIPYVIVGGIRFFERREIKDLVAYLRIIINPEDGQALARIANVPPRGIGPRTLLAFLSGKASGLALKDKEKIEKLEKLISELRKDAAGFKLSQIIIRLIKKISYQEYLDDGSPQSESRIENIKELVSLAGKYDQYTWKEAGAKLVEEMALASAQDEIKNREDRVRLMTAHSAKGLEFPAVFVTGLEEEIFPHKKSASLGRAEMEEERRLIYVAMTRAEKRLYLNWASTRSLFGQRQIMLPSRFLRELPEEIAIKLEEMLGDESGETLYAEE